MNTGQAMVSVGIAMVLRDQFTNQANAIGRAYRSMMDEIYASSMAPRGLTEMVWSQGAAGAAMATIGGMVDAYQYMADAENDLFLVQKMTNATMEQREDILKRIQEVNLKTPLETKDLTSAARFMAMAGNTPEAIKGMMEPVAELASIFGMQAGGKGGVADLFTNISMMFGRNLEDQQEAFRVANELYAVTTGSNTNLSDLAQAITYSGAEMRRAGYGLKETAVSIGVMGNLGIQGSAAGTALANMMRYIQLSASGQKQKGSDMLKAVGIDAKSLMDSEGHLIPLLDIYKKMYEATKGLDTFSKNEFFYHVFGVRGTREIAAMVQMLEDAVDGADKYTQLMERIEESTNRNDTQLVAEQRLKESQGQLDLLQSQLDIFKVNVGKGLQDLFDPILMGVNKLLELLNQIAGSTMGGIVVRGIAIGTAIQLALRAVTAIVGMFRMATTAATALNSVSKGLSAGPAAANAQWALMEMHLRTIIVLMSEYMAMNNMIRTGGIATPYGTIFSRNGRPMVTNTGAGVRGMGLNRGLDTMTGAVLGASAARQAGQAGAQVVARSLGSRILGFLAGPWGIGLSILGPMVFDGLKQILSKQEEQIDTIKEQFNPDAVNQHQQELLREVLEEAARQGIITGISQAKPLDVNVNLDDYGGGNNNVFNFMNDPNNQFSIFPF